MKEFHGDAGRRWPRLKPRAVDDQGYPFSAMKLALVAALGARKSAALFAFGDQMTHGGPKGFRHDKHGRSGHSDPIAALTLPQKLERKRMIARTASRIGPETVRRGAIHPGKQHKDLTN